MKLIQDISEHDKQVSFSYPDAFIIRTYDGTEPDLKWHMWRDEAIRANKPFIYYAFYDWFYPAPHQVEEALGIANDKRYAFDVEKWLSYEYPPRLRLLAGMKGLYTTYLAMTDKVPIFYFNLDCLNYLKPIPLWLLGCDLWLAEWKVIAPVGYTPFSHVLMWQFRGEPDYSYWYSTDEEYKLYFDIQPPAPSKVDIMWDYMVKQGWVKEE